MSDYSYTTRMRAAIDAETAHTPYIAHEVAERLVAKLEAEDPDLLRGWLAEQAVPLLRSVIVAIDGSRRASARRTATRSVFAEAAAAAEIAIHKGDMAGAKAALEPVRLLDTVYVVSEDNQRKRLRELCADELMFVASRYENRARENAFHATFHRALANKVGNGRVEDHFSEEDLQRMLSSLNG